MIRVNRSSFTVLIALILGWVGHLFFYRKSPGISFPLYLSLLLEALFCVGWLEGKRPKWRNLWLLIPLIFFATMVCLRANTFMTVLNLMASLTLLALVAHFFCVGQVDKLGLADYACAVMQTVADSPIQPPALVSASVDLKAVRKHGMRNAAPVARGCLLALPVLAVFTCFLASADAVFASYLEDLAQFDVFYDLASWFWQAMIVLGAAWLVAGGLTHAMNRDQAARGASSLEKAMSQMGQIPPLGFVEATTLLTLVDLLFLAFVWIQFTYLFGGQANITIEGYTYAEYARRGFFELLAVSVLALGLILTLHRLTRRATTWQEGAITALSSVMVLSALVILASAFQRLLLYKDAFGYTQLRLYSHVFMVWLGITFLWFLIVLWLQSDRFALGAFLSVIGFLITLNVLNPDAFIAEQNVARYQATGKLDIHYLTTLSDDAVPTLVRVKSQLASADRDILENHLRHRLEQLETDIPRQGWPSIHLARQRAYRLLIDNQSD